MEYGYADLAVLSSWSAIEIDNYLKNKNIGFESVQKLAKILREYPVEMGFNYVPLLNAFGNRFKTVSDVALETRLFVTELEIIPDSGRLEELRSALCDVSRGFLREARRDYGVLHSYLY